MSTLETSFPEKSQTETFQNNTEEETSPNSMSDTNQKVIQERKKKVVLNPIFPRALKKK